MTVQTAETKTHYAGNGLTTEWPVPFPVVQDEHIKLIKVGPLGESEEVTTGYAVNGVDIGDVSVTYPTTGEPLAAGWQLTIYREMPLTQTLDLERGGAFDAEVIERQGFDHMVMQIQQVQEQAARALQLAITDVDRTPDDVLGEMFELRDAAQQALSLAQQALQTAQDASQTANGASQATQDTLVQVEQSLQETAQIAQEAQQALQEMEALMQEIEGLAESLEELGNLGEVLQEVQTALAELQDALAALNSLGPGTATVSGFTPIAPEGWEEGWALTLEADGSTTYSAPPEIPEVPLASAPSDEHPDGVAGLVVPDGETIQVENGVITSVPVGFFPGQIVYSSMNTLPDGDKFIFIDGIDGPPGLLPRDAYQGFIDNWLSRSENAALWVDDSVWQAEVETVGFTLKYSKGDGSTTWRPPFLQECFIGASGPGRPVGTSLLDRFQGHAVQVYDGSAWRYLGSVSDAASGTARSYVGYGGSATTQRLVTDGVHGSVRIGYRTEPRSVYGRVMLCVAHANINATEQNIQVLVDSLAHKLDRSDFNYYSRWPGPASSEIFTGKYYTDSPWIGSDPVYRKTIDIGALPSSTTKAVAHGITGINLARGLLSCNGYCYTPAGEPSMIYPMPYINAVMLKVDATNITVTTTASTWNLWNGILTMEYCKA